MFEVSQKPIAKKVLSRPKGREPEGRKDNRIGVEPAFADGRIHYHSGSPASVVQMVRKRVKGKADDFTAADIYFDKENGKYYHNVKAEGKGEVTISNAERTEYQRLSSKAGRSTKTTILAKAIQGGVTKFVRNIVEKVKSTEEESAEEEETAEESIVAEADTFTEGTLMEPLRAVRLYAEGDMRHAASLAMAFEQPGKYDQFARLGEEPAVGGAGSTGSASGGANPAEPEVLVKATEHDKLDDLEGRYGGASKGEILRRVEEKERLEASFGGLTGDMTRERSKHETQPPNRRYDIIQATFFWLPKKTNNTNFMALKDFMRNQKDKLKEEGKIRIVLTDKDSGAKNDESENSYRWVADQLIQDSDLKKIYNVKMTFFKTTKPVVGRFIYRGAGAGQTYADKLSSLGMNDAGFQHTRTDAAETVKSPEGDLMIEATRKPG